MRPINWLCCQKQKWFIKNCLFLSVVPLFFPGLLYFLKIAPTVLLFLVKCMLAFRLVCVYSLNLVQFLLLQPGSAAVVYGNIAFNLNHLLTSVKNDNLESVKARSGIFPKILNVGYTRNSHCHCEVSKGCRGMKYFHSCSGAIMFSSILGIFTVCFLYFISSLDFLVSVSRVAGLLSLTTTM